MIRCQNTDADFQPVPPPSSPRARRPRLPLRWPRPGPGPTSLRSLGLSRLSPNHHPCRHPGHV
ncbi:unnamed protein product [Penicillium olsonii]|nr:unnamed protein product [Penicillium olsonii]